MMAEEWFQIVSEADRVVSSVVNRRCPFANSKRTEVDEILFGAQAMLKEAKRKAMHEMSANSVCTTRENLGTRFTK